MQTPELPLPWLAEETGGAASLASVATQGLAAFDKLERFWRRLRSADVYELDVPRWVHFSRLAAVLSLWRHANGHNAILNTMRLVDTLHRAVSLQGIDDALQAKAIDAVAVTASSYSTGVHWTFCHT